MSRNTLCTTQSGGRASVSERVCVCVCVRLSWEWHKAEWSDGELMLVLFSTTLAKEPVRKWLVCMGHLSVLPDREYEKKKKSHSHTGTHTSTCIYKVRPISLSPSHTNIHGHNAPGLSLSLSLSLCDTLQVSDSTVQHKQQCVCLRVCAWQYTPLFKARTEMSINCETMRNQTERAKTESTVWQVYHPPRHAWGLSVFTVSRHRSTFFALLPCNKCIYHTL